MTLSASVTAIRTLKTFLEDKLSSYSPQIIEEFPNSNDELEYPTISLTTIGSPAYMHLMPYIISQVDNEVDSNLFDSIYAVGQLDFNIQLDLWLQYKADRDYWFERIMDALDSQFVDNEKPTGLSLELEDYHGVIARYDQTGYNYLDGEQASQREEWRIQFTLTCSFVRAVMKTEPKIIEAKITHEIGDNNEIGDGQDDKFREETEIF